MEEVIKIKTLKTFKTLYFVCCRGLQTEVTFRPVGGIYPSVGVIICRMITGGISNLADLHKFAINIH